MDTPTASTSPRRLVDILRLLPPSELESLIARLGISIVAAKRIDEPAQVARALVSLPEIRDPSRLPNASAELLHRIAEARGLLLVQAIPPGLEPLVARGIVFARVRNEAPTRSPTQGSRTLPSSSVLELVLPYAFLVQLRTWEGEDPRGIRALLAQAPFETGSAIASHYLGRTSTPPVSLSLEAAWEVLDQPARLREEIERLAPVERRLLEAIEREGGEVDTEELLDIEREPMRLRRATGATPSRRGVGFALERRGFLVPVHPNRHVVPTEVAAIVGAARLEERETRRAQIRSSVLAEDHLPRRARFAADPAPLAVALALAIREPGFEVRAGVGTPKSLVAKLAQRFGREPEVIAIIAALSRAIGLWDPSAISSASPPGSLALHELGPVLYAAWWRGGAWDEARPDPEVLRVASDSRDASPVGVLREMVVDALRELGEGRWVPWDTLAGYVRADTRTAGVARLLRRWAERWSFEPPSPVEVARRIVLESLPALGVVDVGHDDADGGGTAVRLTPRGRAWLTGKRGTVEPVSSQFVDGQALRIGPHARLAAVFALSPLAEIGKVDEQLELLVTAPALARALSVGIDSDIVKARIEAVAPLPESLSRLVAQASVVVGRGSFAAASGFLWVDDPNVRELLRTRRQTADAFLDPSPPGGLLVAPSMDLERLVRRCRPLGVEIVVEGQVVRAKSTLPPASSTPPPVSRRSVRPPKE